jgi:hypothetical protein
MQNRVTVLFASVRKIKTKDGREFSFTEAQCHVPVVDEHGVSHPEVGVMRWPDKEGVPAPGEYEAEFVLAPDFDRRIVAKVVRTRPLKVPAQPGSAGGK